MPTYDYECSHCGRVFEVFQNMSDDPIEACDHCGGSVRRLIGGGLGIIFKGSGFYVTDNKAGAKKAGSHQTAVKDKTSETAGEGGAVSETSPSTGSGGGAESGKVAAAPLGKSGGTAVKPEKT